MESTTWTEHNLANATMVLHYERLPVGYFVGGGSPRTVACVVCGRSAIRKGPRFIHAQTVGLNKKNDPQASDERFCPVPPPLSDAQRRALRIVHEKLLLPVEKQTYESLDRMKLTFRGKLTDLGKRLLQENW